MKVCGTIRTARKSLLELGRVYRESYHDTARARNVWKMGVKKFRKLTPEQQKEKKIVGDGLMVNLARLENEAGNYAAAIQWFQAAQQISPDPAALQRQIDDIRKRMNGDIPAPAKPN